MITFTSVYNLTAHPIRVLPQQECSDQHHTQTPLASVVTAHEQGAVEVHPSGVLARIPDNVIRRHTMALHGGPDGAAHHIPVVVLERPDFWGNNATSSVTNLPAPAPEQMVVVSRLAAMAVPDRGDVFFPFGEIRDESGRIVGVASLAQFAQE